MLRLASCITVTGALFLALSVPGLAQTAPAGKALQFRKTAILDALDNQSEAYHMLAPAGWKVEGGITWDFNHPAGPAALRIRAASADGQAEYRLFPPMTFEWSQLEEQGLGLGAINKGFEIQRCPRGAAAAIEQFVMPRYRREVRGAKVSATTALPKMAQAVGANLRPGAQVEALTVRIEYREGETAVEEDITCVMVAIPSQAGVIWVLDNISSCKAAKGQLDALMPVFGIMNCSVTPDIRWFDRMKQVSALLVQGAIRDSQELMKRWRIMVQAQGEITQIIRQEYENRQATNSRVMEAWSQAFRGVNPYTNPIDHSTVEVPTIYSSAWVNALGEYQFSTDPTFDPNIGSTQKWERMGAKR